MKPALLLIALGLAGCTSPEGRAFILGDQPRASGAAQVDTYEQNRNRDLIMQHGSGGCVPDFVTGGCL